jgi:uncharacterized membrane protein YidH (DUF202 family)
MRTPLIIGVVLIVAGVVALAYGGVSYTTREEVIDVGPLEVAKEERRTFPIPPVAGGALLVGGLVLVILGARGR